MNSLSLKGLLLCSTLVFSATAFAQTKEKPLPNWQNLDLKADGMFGMSTERAYKELLKNKKSTKVIVAVLDGGADINHEDLKSIIWLNAKEVAGNKADDDKNGYADDIHGWSFIGSAQGNVNYDNLELTRLVRKYRAQFAGATESALNPTDKATYASYQAMEQELDKKTKEAQNSLQNILGFKQALQKVEQKIAPNGNLSSLTVKDFNSFVPEYTVEERIKNVALRLLPNYKNYTEFRKKLVEDGVKHYNDQLEYHLNVAYDPRDIVGDNYSDGNERLYGNADVVGPRTDHGSHVSGIIAAVRDNNLGIKGVADNVAIMVLRTTPEGDERDKDVANAIRYAADNGAKVINMSFGKGYSWDKKVVDDAVKYAVSKDVLIIHAAGNDNVDIDTKTHYPTRVYEDKSGVAEAWIEVGASGFKDDKTLKASFSNYGKTLVDVYAPGVAINSTTPNSTYSEFDGTSMAAPVVAGLAALIRSYYPALTAVQVKDVILRSVVKVNHKVVYKDGEKDKSVDFADLCRTGGIVNAYNALQLAETVAKN
jgi:subtilisin family serine protease